MAKNYMNISKETYNLLINVRDFISILAIIAIIPILAHRFSGVITPQSLHEDIEKKESQIKSKKEEIQNIKRQMEEAEKLNQPERYESLGNKVSDLESEKSNLQRQRDEAKRNRLAYYFYSAVTIGVATLLIGVFIPLLHAGLGFMIGGLFTIGHGYWIFWDYLGNIIATISLVIALIGLVAGMLLYRPRSS